MRNLGIYDWGIIIALVIVILILIYTGKESFYSSDYYPKNINYTSEDLTVLSNGTVQKTKMQDGEYLYEYFYNLPNSFSEFQVVRPGVLFNEKLPKRKYTVLAGESRDSLKEIGQLNRRGDGYHVFSIKTKEDYKITAIKLDDNTIHHLVL